MDKNYVKYFLDTLKSDNKSALTIKNYKLDLKKLTKYLKNNNIEIDQATLMDLRNYKTHLNNLGLADSSVSRNIACVKSFYNFLEDSEIIEKNPTEKLKQPSIGKKEPRYMSTDEVKRVLRATSGEQFEDRDKLMMVIMLTTGVRIAELLSIDYEDISEDNFITIRGKGNKERKVLLVPEAQNLLDRYLDSRGHFGGALFRSARGTRLKMRSAQYMIEKYVTKANLNDGVSAHKFRHTSATMMLENGIDIRTIQEILGHSDISTTQKYMHVTKERKVVAGDIMNKQFAKLI